MSAVIYCRGRSSMQSGTARSGEWVLEEVATTRNDLCLNPVTGWQGGVAAGLRLVFRTQEQAESYAKAEGLDYRLYPGAKKRRIVKSYARNFVYDRVRPWTH